MRIDGLKNRYYVSRKKNEYNKNISNDWSNEQILMTRLNVPYGQGRI